MGFCASRSSRATVRSTPITVPAGGGQKLTFRWLFAHGTNSSAEDHLRALERKGALEILPGSSRGLRIVPRPGEPVQGTLPLGVWLLVALPVLLLAFSVSSPGPLPAPVVAKDKQAIEVATTHEQVKNAGVANASRLRRFAPFDFVFGALFVLALCLSWPCATRVFRARRIVARFSIRRRGPPAFLAAA